MSEMKTWSVVYTRIPTNFNSDEVAMVEAKSVQGAYQLVKRQLGDDRRSLTSYVIQTPEEYNPPPIDGRIISMAAKKR